jgi:hypothetical protein
VLVDALQFSPGNSSEVLVTSADSQIRVFDGVTLVQKFRGNGGHRPTNKFSFENFFRS